MDRFYALGAAAALEKLAFLGRLTPAMREGAYETTKRITKELPSKAKKLKIPKEELAKMKFPPGSTGPW